MRIINIEAERGGWGGGGQEENPRRISPREKRNIFLPLPSASSASVARQKESRAE
jgi:hypothetical protein